MIKEFKLGPGGFVSQAAKGAVVALALRSPPRAAHLCKPLVACETQDEHTRTLKLGTSRVSYFLNVGEGGVQWRICDERGDGNMET